MISFLKRILPKKVPNPKASWSKLSLSQEPALQVIDVGVEMAKVIREVNEREITKASKSKT